MSVFRAIAFSSLERYVGFIIAFTTTVFISRLLTPAEVGAFSVAMSIAGVASVLREFGASNYLVRTPNITAHLESCAFGLTLLLGCGLGGLTLVLAAPIANFFDQPEIATLLRVLSINFFLLPFATVNYALIQREMRFALSARIGIAATALSATLSIYLAWIGFGSFSLAWGAVALTATTVLLNICLGPGSMITRPRLKGASELMSFGLKTTAMSMIWEISGRFPEFIVGKFLGVTPAGLLSRSTGLVANLNELLLKGLQPVTLPYFSRVEREGGDLAETHYRIAAVVTGIGWPLFIILAICAEPLTLTIYGEQWLDIVVPVQILCLSMAYALLFSYQPQVVMVKNEMSALVNTNLICVPFQLLFIAVGAFFGVNETCIALIASQLLITAVASRVLYPKIGVSLNGYLKNAWVSFPLALATLGGALAGSNLAAWLNASRFITVILVGILGLSTALVALILTNHPVKTEVEALVRRKRWVRR